MMATGPAEAQDKSSTVEAYTGPPILLPEPEAPPAPRIVEQRVKKVEKFDNGEPRIIREVARYSDDSMVGNGSYKEYYQSGQLFVSGAYKLGLRVGDWTYHHNSGEEAKKVTYVDGKPDGKVEVRRADGTLQAQEEYKNGKRHGTWISYDATGEQKLRESIYDDGKPDGVWKSWYPNGQQQREITFAGGTQNGQATEWDKEGVKRGEATFVDGKRDGETTEWRPDGSVIKRTFKAGKLVTGISEDDQ